MFIDTALAEDNSSRLRKNLLEIIKKLIMTTNDKTEDEKLQDDITEKQQKYQHYRQ